MGWWNDVRFRVDALFGRTQMKSDLDEEIAFHLVREAEKLEAEGHSPAEAYRLARVRFGGEERFREEARTSWGVSPLMDVLSDLRYAVRQLASRPAFSALAVLTLALGIGGTVALFSVVNGLLIRPLPVDDEEELVTFWADYDWRGVEFDFVKGRFESFTELAAYSDDSGTLQGEDGARLVLFSVGSAEFFSVLGARPQLGRVFQPGDDRPGAEPIVVLSHDMWTRDFGGDREILGRRLELDGTLRTVVGVMPDGFFYPSPESEAWVPLDLDPAKSAYTNSGWLVLTGRLRPGVTPEQVSADLDRVTAAMGERFTYPEAWDKSRNAYFTPTREFLIGDVRPVVMLLLGAVGLVLLMACANVAALLVTRTADRRGEMAIRSALGGSRGRLARQIVTESVVLGAVAGAAGLALSVAVFDTLVAGLPLPRALDQTLSLDFSALAVGLVLSLLAGIFVSLGPLHRLLRGQFAAGTFTVRSSGATATRESHRLQHALVASEVLLAVVLATGASLLIRTVGELRSIDWGLEPNGVLTADVMLPPTDAEDARGLFFDALIDRVEALPDVESAGMINRIPVRDLGWQGPIRVAARPELDGPTRPNAYFRPVSPRAFEAMGAEIVRGRGILETDGRDAAPVAVVNEAFVREIFLGNAAVGEMMSSGFLDDDIQIVGVVRDIAVDDLVGSVPPAVYYSWAQTLGGGSYGILVARTRGEPGQLTPALRSILHELEPRGALGRVETMDEVVAGAMAEPLRLRFFLTLFSALGITLGAVGIYGVVSYAVQRRRAEFGIRLALGATPVRLRGEVLRTGLGPVLLGVVGGAVIALAGSSTLAGFLFEVQPTDPISLASAVVGLLIAGLGAALIPAWRASRTDPAVSLRDG